MRCCHLLTHTEVGRRRPPFKDQSLGRSTGTSGPWDTGLVSVDPVFTRSCFSMEVKDQVLREEPTLIALIVLGFLALPSPK